MDTSSVQCFTERATPLLLMSIQVRIWWPLLLDRPTGVHLWILPTAVGVAASQESHHFTRFWGVAICEVSLLPIWAVLSWFQHKSCYVHRLYWWAVYCVWI